MSRILLLGPAPGPSPGPPLGGRVGARLAALAGVWDLSAHFDLDNVLKDWPGAAPGGGDRFPLAEVREALRNRPPARSVVYLGRELARLAAVLEGWPAALAPCTTWQLPDGRRRAWIPHPSGRNRWYNDPANVARASAFLAALAAGPPQGGNV